jgi:pantetheine-phosphate adenylyltransferase
MTTKRAPSTALCPGSFDPLTNGHVDIVRRAAALFERLVVGISVNPGKQPLLSFAERLEMAQAALADLANVSVDAFDGLLVDFARRHGATVVVRGVRSVTDFDYEVQMAMTNRRLHADLDTVFLAPSPEVSFVSSRFVKEILALGGDVGAFVPPVVLAHLSAAHRKGP